MDPLTIECSYWRNPVTPEPATGFDLQSSDFATNPNLIDATVLFTVAAAGGAPYTPAPITSTAITYAVSAGAGEAKPRIQSLSTYTISIQSPVPLEIATTGCYLEVEFPRELQVLAGSRTYTGKYLLATSGTSSSLTPVLEDFSGPRALVVFKGCTQLALKGKNKVSSFLEFEMPNIKNPYAEQETSPFNIKIFGAYDVAAKTGSLEIAASSTFTIAADTYQPGLVSDIAVTADSYIVQEATTQRYRFKIQNEVPGTTDAGGATDIQAGVHIHFPSSFSAGSSALVVGVAGGGVATSGTPTATLDTSAYYDPLC
jgi:hypothetical protein